MAMPSATIAILTPQLICIFKILCLVLLHPLPVGFCVGSIHHQFSLRFLLQLIDFYHRFNLFAPRRPAPRREAAEQGSQRLRICGALVRGQLSRWQPRPRSSHRACQGSLHLFLVASSQCCLLLTSLLQDLRVIKEHWNWLVNDMSTACSFFTRESEKEENELWDFLLMKFTSMAQQEAKKRVRVHVLLVFAFAFALRFLSFSSSLFACSLRLGHLCPKDCRCAVVQEMQREREREKAMERERQLEIATFVDNKHKYAKKQANIMINEEEEEDNKAKEKRFEEMDQSRQALWKKLFPKISTIERLIVGTTTCARPSCVCVCVCVLFSNFRWCLRAARIMLQS